jgi:hypothetical protein
MIACVSATATPGGRLVTRVPLRRLFPAAALVVPLALFAAFPAAKPASADDPPADAPAFVPWPKRVAPGKVATIKHAQDGRPAYLKTLTATLEGVKGRYVRVTAHTNGLWLFADEVFVNPEPDGP